MKRSVWVNVGVIASLAAAVACTADRLLVPPTARYSLEVIPGDGNYNLAVPGKVKVCVFDSQINPVPEVLTGTFTTTENPNDATTTQESPSGPINEDECSITWLRNAAVGDFDVTVTQTGPAGFALERLVVFNQNFTPIYDSTRECTDEGGLTPSYTASINATNTGVVYWFKQCPPDEPPPPEGCFGLTPGYWKNYANHYTEAQFALLVDELPAPYNAMTNAQIKTILSTNNPAIPRLRKFLVANLLTLALTNHPELPNPSGGELGGDCVVEDGGDSLAEAIARAIEILANPGNYSNAQIIAAGSLLDAFANL